MLCRRGMPLESRVCYRRLRLSDMLLSALPPGPFARLAALLGDVKPGKDADQPGGGRSVRPGAGFRHARRWPEQPPASAIIPPSPAPRTGGRRRRGWLNRRFALNGAIDPEKNVLPLNGTREGLFSVLFPLMPETKAGARPIVAMPNPFYQCYAAAALAPGAEPLYVPALKENGFLPDLRRPARSDAGAHGRGLYLLARPIPKARWRVRLIGTTCSHWPSGMTSSCWRTNAMPTSGSTRRRVCALPARLAQSGGFTRLLTFHSLSKRSGLPGLRSGMVAGDAELIEKFRAFRNVAGPTVPAPLLAASRRRLARRRPCRRQPRRLSREDGGGGSASWATG